MRCFFRPDTRDRLYSVLVFGSGVSQRSGVRIWCFSEIWCSDLVFLRDLVFRVGSNVTLRSCIQIWWFFTLCNRGIGTGMSFRLVPQCFVHSTSISLGEACLLCGWVPLLYIHACLLACSDDHVHVLELLFLMMLFLFLCCRNQFLLSVFSWFEKHKNNKKSSIYYVSEQ